jgi:predicted nucleic acid-binding protein
LTLPGIVLDTNLVSEPKRAVPDPNVVAWYARQSADQLYVTSTVVAELAFGIELLPAGGRRRSLEAWLGERVISLFAGRILPFDTEDALVYGRLMAAARRRGRPARVGDAEIAAVAIRHGFAIATRNTSDFAAFGAPLLNPWQDPR